MIVELAHIMVQHQLNALRLDGNERQVGKEVVTDEEAEEDKVVNHSLKVHTCDGGEVLLEVLPKLGEVEVTEFVHVGLEALVELVAQNAKVGLVGREAEADQIRIHAVDAVRRVGVVARLRAEAADVVHNLVLALAGDVGIGEHNGEVAPRRVLVELLENEPLNGLPHTLHKGRGGGDNIVVPPLLELGLGEIVLGDNRRGALLGDQIALTALGRGAESAASLLVHLTPRGHAINAQHKALLWADNHHEAIDQVEHALEHLLLALGLWEGGCVVTARMDEAVHVNVEVIVSGGVAVLESIHDGRLGDILDAVAIPSLEPQVEAGDTHVAEI